jgi:uncharacterized protein (TIGR03435 family)
VILVSLVVFLVAGAGAATSFPAAQSAQNADVPRFEVASVRINTSGERPRVRVNAVPPAGRLTITAMTVKDVILAAYGLQPFELQDHGSRILNQQIDIVARANGAASMGRMQRMLQPLLAERFGLMVHREKKEMDTFLLTMSTPGRLGPKITPAGAACGDLVGTTVVFALAAAARQTTDEPSCGILRAPGPGRIIARGLDMATLAADLAPSMRRPILDRTGLTGRYDFDLTYTPEAFTAAALARRGTTAPGGVDPEGPSIYTALQEQLGMRLQSQRAAVDVLVIDTIRPLSDN